MFRKLSYSDVIQWAKKYSAANCSFNQLAIFKDGQVAVTGDFGSNGKKGVVALLDSMGNQLWLKER
ncbi:MAG: hypothetical protein C4308_13985 [Chitinophagaceae bacterium]